VFRWCLEVAHAHSTCPLVHWLQLKMSIKLHISSCGLKRVDRVDLEVEMKVEIHSKQYGKVSYTFVA
jgi:hypothetical protein